MLLVLEVEGLENKTFADIEAGKKVKVTGLVHSCFFDEDYISKLEEKASKYDELIYEETKDKLSVEKAVKNYISKDKKRVFQD